MSLHLLVYGLLALWTVGCASSHTELVAETKRERASAIARGASGMPEAPMVRLDQWGHVVPVERILVTTGTLGRPYEVLGEVSYNTRETINIASIFTDTVFRSPLSVAAAGKTAELSRRACRIA